MNQKYQTNKFRRQSILNNDFPPRGSRIKKPISSSQKRSLTMIKPITSMSSMNSVHRVLPQLSKERVLNSRGSSRYTIISSSSRGKKPKTQYEMIQKRIKSTLHAYEAQNIAQAQDKIPRMGEEHDFMEKVLSRLHCIRDHMLRIDVAMLIDRYRRVLERTGVGKPRYSTSINEDDVDQILLELEDWANRVQDEMGEDIDYDEMDNDDFADMLNVDREYMFEEDLAALKEKFKGLAKLNEQIAETHNLSLEERDIHEEEKKTIQAEIAEKIKESNHARNKNAGFIHAADEIFHLIEKARSEGDGVSVEDYQQQIADVLKELVKRDADAKGQTKKIKELETQVSKNKEDFQKILSEHKTQHNQLETATSNNERLVNEVSVLRKKLTLLQKDKIKNMNNTEKSNLDRVSVITKTDSEQKLEKEKLAQFEKLQTQYRILEEQMKAKDQRLATVSEKLKSLNKKLENEQSSVLEKEPERKERKSEMVKTGRASKKPGKSMQKPKEEPSTAILPNNNDNSDAEKLKKDLEAATKREQLIAKSNEKLLKEIELLKIENESMSKKTDLATRELDNVKAELTHVKKTNDKTKNSISQKPGDKSGGSTHTTRHTHNAVMQTEKEPVKHFSVNVQIPTSCPEIDEKTSLAKLVKILAVTAKIKDVSIAQKILKRANEKEVKSVQQQIQGFGDKNGPYIPSEKVSEPNLEHVIESGIDIKMLEETLATFGETLDRVGHGVGDMINNLRTSIQTMSNTGDSTIQKEGNRMEQKLQTIEENTSDLLEVAEEISAFRPGKVKKKQSSRRTFNETFDEFKKRQNEIPVILGTGIQKLGVLMHDQLERLNKENRNLRKRVANMNNMDRRPTIAPSSTDKNFSGDNAESILDDIQSILETRLRTARQRPSTINFSQLVTNSGGGVIRVGKPKTADAASTRSDPLPRQSKVLGINKAPSVMAVMRSMSTQNGPPRTASPGMFKPQKPQENIPKDFALRSNQIQKSQVDHPESSQWMGRFEKEYKQTKLRNQRAKQNMQLSNTPPISQFNQNKAIAIGFGSARGKTLRNDSGLDNFMHGNTASRNRLNPVFGANLPKLGTMQLGFGNRNRK